MTCACSEMYLKDAMRTLGETVDFALFDQVLNPAELMAILSNSREMKQFERGMPRAICGMSGDELAREIYQKQLAAQSGVTLRVIQLYEQNQLDLRRARSPRHWRSQKRSAATSKTLSGSRSLWSLIRGSVHPQGSKGGKHACKPYPA